MKNLLEAAIRILSEQSFDCVGEERQVQGRKTARLMYASPTRNMLEAVNGGLNLDEDDVHANIPPN